MPFAEATDADFLSLLAAHPQVLVKYYADWCGHCQLLAPVVERLAQHPLNQGVYFVKVNAEYNPQARRLAQVTGLPFFAIFRQGKLVRAAVATSEAAIQQLLTYALGV
jgi:thiol-disulfide isomerase/thioredoxin